MSQTIPSPSSSITLEETIARLARHAVVEGVVLIGSTGTAAATPDSDYDLVVVLRELPAALDVGVTTIEGRFTDLLFVRSSQIDELLALEAPVDGAAWLGRIIRWLLTGQIAFDRTGRVGQAKEKARSADWLLPISDLDVYQAWFSINYNLAQARRMIAATDPVYHTMLDVRFAVYSAMDLLYYYLRIRKLRWQGEKEAIRYLAAHDPSYLETYLQFVHEREQLRRLALYEQLAAQAIAPAGGLWPAHGTAVHALADGAWRPGLIADSLAFWERLVSDEAGAAPPRT